MTRRSHQKLSDLVRECQQGSNPAWHELVDIVGPVIFSICRKSRLSRDESFDVYGQVCFELVKSIRTVREPEKLPSLVAVITRRQIFGHYQKSRLLEYLDEETMQHFPDEVTNDPEKTTQDSERNEILFEAILSLPERDYRLIKALFLDPQEPSYEEIARDLKMPVSSIGPTRGKALAKLYKILKKKKEQI